MVASATVAMPRLTRLTPQDAEVIARLLAWTFGTVVEKDHRAFPARWDAVGPELEPILG